MRTHNFPKNATNSKKWEFLKFCCKNNLPVIGYITKYSEYFGFSVNIDDIEGSMNKFELSCSRINDPNLYVGKYVVLYITKVNILTHELKLSRKRISYFKQVGDIVQGYVEEVYGNQMYVDAGFKVRLSLNNLPHIEDKNIDSKYKTGDSIELVLLEDIHRERYTSASARFFDIWEAKKKNLNEGDIINVTIDSVEELGIEVYIDDFLMSFIHYNFLSDSYKRLFRNKSIIVGTRIKVAITGIDNEKRKVLLSQKLVDDIIQKQAEEQLKSQIERGCIVEAEVIDVSVRDAVLKITGTDFKYIMKREDLSPNKIINASDEVFIGQILQIVYLGEINGKMEFSRKYFVEDRYDENLYELSLKELLAKMNIGTTLFCGKVVKIENNFFFKEIMSVAENGSDDNGKLLIDPITGKNLFAVLSEKIIDKVEEGNFYEFTIDLATKKYRQKRGTPFLFCVNSDNLRQINNPYNEAISLAFTKHRSPGSNTSLEFLINEFGLGLYSSKKRMFFELIQNADDASSLNGVQIKLQLLENYFVLTHDGYAFSKHDFDSITSAAKSTKGSNKKKTGYKGIGFKSVFTNSDTVQIKSGGFNFIFDKSLPIYNDFKKFYFYVNNIENNPIEQEKFLHTYEKEFREFIDVRDIPWQLLPILADKEAIEGDSIFNGNENVAIALKMAEENLTQYKEAIEDIFKEPRFMLFLRNTKRVQLIQNGICKTIQKTTSKQNNTVSLANSFNTKNRIENYHIYTSGEIVVDDDAFEEAGIPIKRVERKNSRGDTENFLANIDESGKILKTTIDVPDRIASSTETSISIALRLDEDGAIHFVDKEDSSLYAYLPMNEHRYKFPFYINADFIPNSDREGIKIDNPWNHFIFYHLGKNIVKMVSENATLSQPKYLNLLMPRYFASDSSESKLLVEAFNKGYEFGLSEYAYIINDQGNKSKAEEIIYDNTGLADLIGHEDFYMLIGTKKHLPNINIESTILKHSIFGVESVNKDILLAILENNIDETNTWLDTTSEEQRLNFFQWISEDEDCKILLDKIHVFKFDKVWYSINDINLKDKRIVTTLTYVPILSILKQLGFSCSDNIIEDHPLAESFSHYIQKDEDLFNEIIKSDISSLSFEERLLLFKNAALFSGIGEASLKSWKLFKNAKGEDAYLNEMIAYNETEPIWLHKYMLSKEYCCDELIKYTVNPKDTYSSIIVPFINDILENVDIYDVFKKYQHSWQSSLTNLLIKQKTKNIISVVEQSDSSTKLEFINELHTLNIDSNKKYSSSNEVYRCLKIASSEESLILPIRKKITIDGESLSEFTLKDEFTVQVKGSSYKFLLSEIIPNFEKASKLSKIIENFKSLPSIEKIFELTEVTNLTWVKNNLIAFLSADNNSHISAQQFAFFCCYEMMNNKLYFEDDIKPHIKIESEKFFIDILQYCFDKNMASVLRNYHHLHDIDYPYENLAGTYFGCGIYALESEETPIFVSTWADTDEKKDFLIDLDLHDNESDEIKRRYAFYNQKENKSIWNIYGMTEIQRFLNWVKQRMTLPFSDSFHTEILIPLLSNMRCNKEYSEKDLNTASEWNDDRYKDWKTNNNLRIYIYNGKIPYSCSYDETVFCIGAENDYHYFPESKHLYINGNLDAASVLSTVYPISGVFEKDDWHYLFFVTRDSVSKYTAENESLRNRVAELEDIINQYRGAEHTGKDVSERGNVGSNDQESINREVRIMAKPLLRDHNYDVSEWDPVTSPPDIIGIIKTPEGEPINVIVRSAKGRKIHLAATSFESLMSNPKNLLIVRGEDGEIHTVDFQELFGGNSNVNLIFDANFTPLGYFKALGTIFKYVKNTDFVIENPHYSAFDEIKGFGLDIKNDGIIIIGAENDI